eukprot:TRINITY_DN497_c0_g3_i1.p1 TRINITY_DN497_c0_g3~~TRINITY_DN497_c0_g3_i1.p1  ORF type:complete len:530 (+),score=123.87 TRINITY_DN497_c0_g3_i1:129-1718(+)
MPDAERSPEGEQRVPLTDAAQAEDSRRAWWAPGPLSKMNHNVALMYILSVWQGIGDSIWTGTVIVAFIYILADKSNTTVGVVEAAQGFAVALAALPLGWVADKMGRSVLIKTGAICCMILVPATAAFAIYADDEGTPSPTWIRWVFLPFMCLWGIAGGIISGPAQALFADSLPPLTRSRAYTNLNTLWLVSGAIGPAFTVYWFFQNGDDWTLRELRNLILIGLGFEFICDIHLLFFDDKKALPREDDTHVTQKEVDEGDQTKKLLKGWITAEQVPYLLFACELTTALGSGMTVKFFPLFFKEDLDLSPAKVQILYVCAPLAMSIFSYAVLRLTKVRCVGRPLACVLARAVGLGFLVALVVLRHTVDRVYLCIFYVIRTGLMNSTYPVEESIMMDFVPRETRARWKSLQSVSIFGWCGSAFLGGVIGDHYGYAHTFVITAIVQAAGNFPLVLLYPVVPAEREDGDAAQDTAQSPAASSGAKVAVEGTASPKFWGGSLQQGEVVPVIPVGNRMEDDVVYLPAPSPLSDRDA